MEMKLKFANIRTFGSEKSFTTTLQVLEFFSTFSALKFNNKKTEVLWIVSCTGCKDQLSPEKNLRWVKAKTKWGP